MTKPEMKLLLNTLYGNIGECQKFHPDFNDEMVCKVQSRDQTATYYIVKLGLLKMIIVELLKQIEE